VRIDAVAGRDSPAARVRARGAVRDREQQAVGRSAHRRIGAASVHPRHRLSRFVRDRARVRRETPSRARRRGRGERRSG